MDTAKIFWAGRSQAVRLPKEYRLDGKEVRIRRHGSAVILEPLADEWSWLDAITGMLDDDFVEAAKEQPVQQQERAALDEFFPLMRYLLDANAVIGLLNDSNRVLAQRARRERPTDLAISVIVAHELYYGAFKSRRRERNVALVGALQFPVLEFDKEDAVAAAEIRASLAAAGMPIGPYDILIAGQALARNLILISHNTREFGRVPGLRLEDWEA